MICMLIVIPLFILLSSILQLFSLLTDNFANNQGYQDSCSSEDAVCVTSRVFGWLGFVSTIIPLFIMLILLFCSFDSELFRKKTVFKSRFFKSTRCQIIFVNLYNSLLILLPLSFVSQLISISTETESTKTSTFEVQEGFSLYVISMFLIICAFIAHPGINSMV